MYLVGLAFSGCHSHKRTNRPVELTIASESRAAWVESSEVESTEYLTFAILSDFYIQTISARSIDHHHHHHQFIWKHKTREKDSSEH